MFSSKALRRKRRTRLVTVLAWLLMESARTTRIIVMGTSSLLDHVVIKMTIYHLLFSVYTSGKCGGDANRQCCQTPQSGEAMKRFIQLHITVLIYPFVTRLPRR